MTWTIVEFLESHEVEAVPTSWLYQDENNKMQCYWPPLELGSIEKAIKNETDVNTCWPLYHVRVFKNGTFGNYQTARLKSRKAEDTSDLSSGNEGRRKRKMRPLSSDEEEEEERSILPSPPPLYITPRKQSEKRRVNEPAGESPNLSIDELENEENGKKDKIRDKDKSCSCCPLHNVSNFETLLRGLIESQKNLKAQVLQLRDDLKGSEKNLARNNNVSLFTQFKCPLSSEADIGSIEKYLEEINNYNSAVMEFSKQGGRDLYDFIRRCLSSVMKNSLAAMYSYHGKKNKLAFKNLMLHNAIIEAANLRKDSDKRSSEDCIGKWLKRAKERKDDFTILISTKPN